MSADLLDYGFQPFEAPASETVPGPLPTRALMATMRENMLKLYGGPAFTELNLMGKFLHKRSLMTSDPAVIKTVLVDRADQFQRTTPTMRILKPVLGEGLFLSEGAKWRQQRRIMAPAFAPRAMDIVAAVSQTVADETVDALRRQTGQAVYLMRVMQNIALEVAGQAMFSMPMTSRGARLRALFETYGMSVGRPFPLDMVLPQAVPSPTDLKRRRLGRKWLDYIAALIEERARMPKGSKDLFDLLTAAEDPDTGKKFDRTELRDQFATMIIAGHETTALTLLWAMIMLAMSKPLQAAIANESHQLPAGRPATAKELESLKFTRATILETLRLFPPAFLIVREAKGPVRLAGRILFKGDLVNIAPWVLQRHHAHWDRPELFDPGRFIDNPPSPKSLTYLPFGIGPRICIGMSFALTEATAILAAMAQHFEISMTTAEPIQARAVVTTYPDPLPSFMVQPRITTARSKAA